jgi:hypothetical protein
MNAWKWAGLAAYLRPDTMISLTTAFLALCGFK